jgi:hypothetical protein
MRQEINVDDIPANELIQPPLSRLTPWERRSSHVPLTAPGTTVTVQAGDDKNKQQDEISPPDHKNKQNSPNKVSSICITFTKPRGL